MKDLGTSFLLDPIVSGEDLVHFIDRHISCGIFSKGISQLQFVEED